MVPAVFDFVDYISSLQEIKKHISVCLFVCICFRKQTIFLNKKINRNDKNILWILIFVFIK